MDEKLRILLCEDDENLGMLLRDKSITILFVDNIRYGL